MASTHDLSFGGLVMASRRGFWLRIDVFELPRGRVAEQELGS